MTSVLKRRRFTKWGIAFAVLLIFGLTSVAHAEKIFKKNSDGTYQIDATVHFPTGAKRIWQGHKRRMRKIAKFLKKHPEITMVSIVGHADSRGSDEVNQKLSGARARFVKKTLVKLGVEAERLQVIMRGAEDPKASNKSKMGRGKNRRVEFVAEAAGAQAVVPPVEEESTAEAEPVAEEEVVEEETTVAEGETVEEEVVAEEEAVVADAEETPAEEPEEPEAEAEELPAEEPEPEPAVIAPVAPPAPPPFELFSWQTFEDYKHWIAAGATTLSTVIAVGLGASASATAATLDNMYVGNDDHTGAQEEARRLGVAADVFYTVSAIGMAGTAWLFYDKFYAGQMAEPETSVGVMPTEGGAMIQIRFKLDAE